MCAQAAIATALGVLVAGCGGQASVVETARPPDGWVRVDDPAGISFYAPAGVERVPVVGFDSQVAEYTTPTMTIGYDLGIYSSWLCADPVLSREERLVNGRPGRVVTALSKDPAGRPYLAAVYFPAPRGSYDELMLEVEVPSQHQLPAALALLSTVVWHVKAGGPVSPCPPPEVFDLAVAATAGADCPAGQGALLVVATDRREPVLGLTVLLTGAGRSDTAITELDGRTTLCAAAGRYQAEVFFDDATGSTAVDLGEGRTVTLTATRHH